MVPSRLTITAALSLVAAAAASCSHEEKPRVATPHPVTQAPPPPARKVVAQAPVEPAEIPKQKEDLAVFFDFDSSLLKDDGRRLLQEVADAVRKKNASLISRATATSSAPSNTTWRSARSGRARPRRT